MPEVAEAEPERLEERHLHVVLPVPLGEGADERRHRVQLVPRKLREEVVLDLALEASVEPVAVPVRGDVARREELEVEEAQRALLLGSELLGAQVREQELHVQQSLLFSR